MLESGVFWLEIALKLCNELTDNNDSMATTTCQMICPNLRCRKILAVPAEVRGKLVKCQHCETMFRVPAPKPAPGTPAAGNPTKKSA